MEENNKQQEYQCPGCHNRMKSTIFPVHKRKCKQFSQINDSSLSRNSSQLSYPSSTISRKSLKPNQQQESLQLIPCVFCGYAQTLQELDTHPQVCQYRPFQCPQCHDSFPFQLMRMHRSVCRNRPPPPPPPPLLPPSSQFFFDPQFNLMPRFSMMRNPQNQYYPPRQQPPRQNRPPLIINDFISLIHLIAGQGLQQQQVGLTRQQINKFPIYKYKKASLTSSSQLQKCIICYCNYQQGDQFMKLTCNHSFHPECIKTWLEKNPTCPICKHNFGPPKNQNDNHYHSRGPIIHIFRM